METLERAAKLEAGACSLKIGVPRETHLQEKRVALTPGAVGVLTARGHKVVVEHLAGVHAQFGDELYREAGATIAPSAAEVYEKSDIICRITPPDEDDLRMLRPRQTLFSAVHLGALKSEYVQTLLSKYITALGFEFIRSADGSIPFMQSMSEIAGISSIHIAAELLTGDKGGPGLLLGGIAGVPPATVTIIGAGNVGYHAAATALALGATVKVIDDEVHQLRRLEHLLGRKIYTCVAQHDFVAHAVAHADVVIGAAYKKSGRPPMVVTEEMVMTMKEGSVIVDVSIDQGGCIETSRTTTHDQPTFVVHGVTHYCVPNIPSRVPRTASTAISNILGPILVRIGEAGGIHNLFATDVAIRTGIYTFQSHVTQKSLAEMCKMDHMDISLLYAAQM
ncbi:MAG: alanine dehydrogenase [Bacteroidia bacterium]|nr:alanine dehydrogenase [Bacteroidia bacterium]MDW8332953.1 alanine dehydrogenase [Bacteroidia bacterium]